MDYIDEKYVRNALPARKPDGHKGNFGKLLVIGGAVGYTGAPYLAASAAVRAGAGLVYLGVPRCIWAIEAAKCASAMPFPLPDDGERLTADALAPIREKLAGCGKMVLGSDSYITMSYIQSQAVNAYQQVLFRCCASKELTHNILGGTVASWMGIDLPATSNVNGLTTPWDRTQIS